MTPLSFIPGTDVSEASDDIRRLFDELAGSLHHETAGYPGEYRPALDVLDTDDHLEVRMDAVGILPTALRVACRDNLLLIVGEKAPPAGSQPHAYHLIEREFGRFARGVRLNGALDVGRARVTLRDGELSVVLPKLSERRGRLHRLSVQLDTPRS